MVESIRLVFAILILIAFCLYYRQILYDLMLAY